MAASAETRLAAERSTPLLGLFRGLALFSLVNSLSPGQVVLGLILGLALPLIAGPFLTEPMAIRRPLTLLRFLAVVAYNIITANIAVARFILSPGDRSALPSWSCP